MSVSSATESRPRLEAVTRDTFIDDLTHGAPAATTSATADSPAIGRR